jgi:poly(A) polymerase
LHRLNQAGHEAYLVGGGVRDLMLGKRPKDFDIATSARPDDVNELFRNCRLIGRRFRLAHIRFGREIIEVATFRAHHDSDDSGEGGRTENGMIMRDNVYGTLEEDAVRRDFTINCLYYDLRDFSVVDFAGGVEDLNNRLIRMMGDPVVRYREDPVRILRAARFAAKLGFEIETETRDAAFDVSYGLEDIPAARLFEEVLKLFMTGHALESFHALRDLDVLRFLFPATDHLIDEDDRAFDIVEAAFKSTDARIAEGKTVTPAFLIAALLWPVLRVNLAGHEVRGMSPAMAIDQAGGQVVADHLPRIAIPKRFSLMAREIWSMQPALEETRGRRPTKLLGNPRLRAAYDFLLLRAEAGEPVAEQAEMWTKLLESEARKTGADTPAEQVDESDAAPKKRRRRRRRKPAGGSSSDAQPAST